MWPRLSVLWKVVALDAKWYQKGTLLVGIVFFLFPFSFFSGGSDFYITSVAAARDWSNCLASGCHGPMLKRKKVHPALEEGECTDCHEKTGKHKFRLSGEGNDLCLSCHENPVKEGENAHPALEEGACTDCHDPHASTHKKLLKEGIPELCYSCHERKDETKYVHGAVLLGRCLKCHKPHSSPYEHLLTKPSSTETCFICHYDDLTGRKSVHPAITEGSCTDCHNPHGSDFKNNLVAQVPELCYNCHESKTEGKVVHGAIEEKGCLGCHNPHGSDYVAMLYRDIYSLCTGCHPDQKDGSHIITGFRRKFHPVKGEKDPKREGRAFSCTSCHNPHSSDHPFLFYEGDSKMEMCKRCHSF